MGKVTDLKFGVWIELKARKPKDAKLGQSVVSRCPASRDLLFIFWDTLHISEMGIASDFKFGVLIDRQATNQKCKSSSKGCQVGHVTYFLFGPLFMCGTTKYDLLCHQ